MKQQHKHHLIELHDEKLKSIIINSKLICLEQKSYQLTQYQQRYYYHVDSNRWPTTNTHHHWNMISFLQGDRLNDGLIIKCLELSFRDNENFFDIFLIHNSQSISFQSILFWWNLTTMKWWLWIINEKKIFFSNHLNEDDETWTIMNLQ